ncbi:TetR/AcrR family transcriptional regulator [Mycobacterium sp.]|uniref:TetR/AcrR family transcriptional regulator n=1 Tax=Mycobacterium sp. TaxID=1785 RepID=UPI002D24B0AF|nr:TetR/AcrR family transcriptional regulator [Mycobacterium sp.]HZA12765.1 TetR/AcrR family transcriptional regulator [Mycobacterium sp.]
MSTTDEFVVPQALVAAAIGAAEQCGRDVADVPVAAIARAAGLSRSTLLRRLGGSRRALDDAVRAAGVEPGGRRPVRERAVEAGATLISERGPVTVTLEAVAQAADCSVDSLYAVFGTRDELFAAIYEQYSPFHDLVHLCADPASDLKPTVAGIYHAMATTLTRSPRVAPAMFADLLGNPNGPIAPVFARYFPKAMSAMREWLSAQVHAGRIRDIAVPLLVQMLIGPLWAHLLFRQVMPAESAWRTVSLEQACSEFTDGFLRAVAVPQNRRNDAKG